MRLPHATSAIGKVILTDLEHKVLKNTTNGRLSDGRESEPAHKRVSHWGWVFVRVCQDVAGCCAVGGRLC